MPFAMFLRTKLALVCLRVVRSAEWRSLFYSSFVLFVCSIRMILKVPSRWAPHIGIESLKLQSNFCGNEYLQKFKTSGVKSIKPRRSMLRPPLLRHSRGGGIRVCVAISPFLLFLALRVVMKPTKLLWQAFESMYRSCTLLCWFPFKTMRIHS